MTDTVLAQLAALKANSISELRRRWQDLFATQAPAYNRRFLESRLAYRIQELAFGGLTPDTVARLEALGEELDGGDVVKRKIKDDGRPITGTRLIREWQGVEHTVTVLADAYEWQGRPYRSLSGVAKSITGVQWSGPVFFGLKSQRPRT